MIVPSIASLRSVRVVRTTPIPKKIQIKFHSDWPTGLISKCEGRQNTDEGPSLYDKLTSCAFGSGELKRVGSRVCRDS